MNSSDDRSPTAPTGSDLTGEAVPSDVRRGLVALPRRAVLAALGATGLALATGCASTTATARRPAPLWPEDVRPVPARRVPEPTQETVVGPDSGGIDGLITRDRWASDRPVPSLMNRMRPVTHITVHHDGLPPSRLATADQCASRIDLIRKGHRSKGWGDIGYHFVVDPSGRIWQGRSLVWQGAHVKDCNEGNIGVLVLGNFEVDRPTSAQLSALEAHLAVLMELYRVPPRSVLTHREWPGASTLCPGRNLQGKFGSVRRNVARA